MKNDNEASGWYFFANYLHSEKLNPGELPVLVMVIMTQDGMQLRELAPEMISKSSPTPEGMTDIFMRLNPFKDFPKGKYRLRWRYTGELYLYSSAKNEPEALTFLDLAKGDVINSWKVGRRAKQASRELGLI